MEDDGILVERARGGDFGAFEALVNRHEQRLYGIALGIVRRPEDAEDAVQTAFLGALEHLGEFRGEAPFASWITQIAANAALKILRKRRGLPVTAPVAREEEDEEGDIAHPEFIADWRQDPARLAEEREVRKILEGAIDGLPEGQRLVFVLRDMAGRSVEETAAALGISRANVKVRLLRARLALRERLTQIFGDPARRLEASHDHGGGGRGSTPAAEILRHYRRTEGGVA